MLLLYLSLINYFVDLVLQLIQICLDQSPIVQMFLISDFPKSNIKVKLHISVKYPSQNSFKP